jgi:hypothetical protein
MRGQTRTNVAALLAALITPAWGGSIYQAVIVAIPQMQLKDGKVSGCGYQLKAMPIDAAAQRKPAVMLDVSFNVYAQTFGLMKGGAEHLNLSDPTKGVNKPISSFWLKLKDQPAPTPLGGKTIPAETRGYLLYGVEFSQTMPLFDAVMSDMPMLLGVHVKGEPVERIYSGTAKVANEEKQQILDCLSELSAGIRATLDAASAPK